MKQTNLTLPKEEPCVVCGKFAWAYGRTRYWDITCSRKCDEAWKRLDWEEQQALHEQRKRK